MNMVVRVSPRAPDIVFVGGTVLTVDKEMPRATGLAVKGERIEAVGDESQIRAMVGEHTQVVELRGRVLIPGFDESHSHLLSVGRNRKLLSLYHCRSIAEIVAEVEKAVRRSPPGAWIEGKGWAEAMLAEGRAPTRYDLDPVSPDNPVILARIYNTDCVNSRALKEAGITRETPDPPGGLIVRDEKTGEPTGLLKENAKFLVRDKMPEATLEDLIGYVKDALDDYVRYGITSVVEPGLTPMQMRAFHQVYREGALTLRVSMMPDFRDRHFASWKERLGSLGIMSGFGDDWLQIGPAKLSLDGGLANMTSYLSIPYKKPGSRVVLRIPPGELEDIILRFHEQGWSVGVHATGDLAQEMVVDAIVRAMDRRPRADVRHHVIHGYFPSDSVLRKMRDYGIVYNLQPVFIYYQGDAYPEVVGREQAERFMPLRRILDAGVRVCINSDVPTAASHNPLLGLYSAVTRKTMRGDVLGADQRITFEEALAAYTLGGAYLLMQEGRRGSLTPGKLADMTVLSRDPTAVPPEEWANIAVDLTMVGGRFVYDRTGEARSMGGAR